jgi:hypothetical protein
MADRLCGRLQSGIGGFDFPSELTNNRVCDGKKSQQQKANKGFF